MSTGGRTAASVLGVSWHQRKLSDLRVSEGRFIDRLDEERHAQVAVVGAAVRRDLFGVGTAVGGRLKINDVWCRGYKSRQTATGTNINREIGGLN